MSRCLILLCLVAVCLGTAAVAEESAEPARPRIGLVLGGGGARGGAHIGVLKALEEMNVPVDYVAGTSMGSIVGALFAVGMSSAEIETTILTVDWDDLFSDRPRRSLRNFRRKQDDSGAFLPVEWGWKGGFVMSSGVIAGQKLSFAFRNDLLYTSGYDGFDNLAYPYRAVTTDLQTGDLFVPDSGNLLKAVRASMSIPGVFPPVRWGHRFLVDGYLASNVPVSVCRDMGADIVIAVDVSALPRDTDPGRFTSLMGINEQKSIIEGRSNIDPEIADADIVIQPYMAGMSSRAFKDIETTLAPGYAAALAVRDQLERLALSPEAYQQHVAEHVMPPPPTLRVSALALDNRSHAHDRAILANIHQPMGEELDLDLLKVDLAKIYDFGIFELLDFHLEERPDGTFTLVINAHPKSYSPNIVNFGITYSGTDGGTSNVDARMRVTRMEMNRFGAELRTDLQAGHHSALRSEFYQPLTMRRRSFVALTGVWDYQLNSWYADMHKWGEYSTRQLLVMPEAGFRLGHYGELRGGLYYGHLLSSDRTGLSLAEFDGPLGGYSAQLRFDMFDLPFLPRHGWGAHVFYHNTRPEFGSGLDYQRLEMAYSLAETYRASTFNFSVAGGSNLDTDLPEFHMFTLGGLARLSGYQQDQLRGNAYALGSVAWYHQLAGSPSPFSTSWFFAVMLEAGNTWMSIDDAAWDDLRYSAAVSFVGTTVLGPLGISYGRTQDGNDAFYLTLGYIPGLLN